MTGRGTQRGDDGAALLIALVFVTVVGLVSGVLLSFSDASLRATVQLRDQAEQAYTADGAAELAINAIRNSTLTNPAKADSDVAASVCSTKSGTSDFPMAIAPMASATGRSTTKPSSALVTCERALDRAPATGVGAGSPAVINAGNLPGFAILALSTATNEPGISLTDTSGTNTVDVKGKIAANSTIDVASGTLKSDSSVYAYTSCTGSIVSPDKICKGKSQAWPSYAPPAVPAARDVPTCPSTGGLVTFSPGVYTNATTLSACDKSNITMWFRPGTYYFNFPLKDAKWTMDAGALVAGTPTADIATTVPVMPGSCVSPLKSTTADQLTPPAADLGVQFVFAGPSQWVVGGKAQVEVCGSYSAGSPTGSPSIAIHSLKEAFGTMPAASNCVVTPGVAPTACPLISSTLFSSDESSLYVQGTLFAPKAWLALAAFRQGTRDNFMHFNGGVIVRSLRIGVDGPSSSVLSDLVGLPAATPVPPVAVNNLPEVVVLLKVYVCPGVTTCTEAKGRLRLRTKVGVSNPTSGAVTAGARAVKIYSWAVQR